MRIAVVGSGISGLVCAHLLQELHDITLIEANNYLGGHTNTVDVNLGDEHHRIDTGFIVFNDWTYPNFIGLLNELGAASQATSMGFSVRCSRCGLEYAGTNFLSLFAQKRNLLSPGHYRMLYDILRFNQLGSQSRNEPTKPQTLGDFLKEHRFSHTFAEHYLLPMGAAIWSCPMTTFQQFPISFILEFYRNHGLLNVFNRPTWHVVQGGSQSYVERIRQQFRGDILLNSPVRKVERKSDEVLVHFQDHFEVFDEVILACHSDQALRMLESPTAAETQVLSSFPYGRNEAVLHTDDSLLPKRKVAWSSWNYHVREGEQRPSVTYNMNILQGIESNNTFCVTLNETESIAPEKVLGSFEYHHPVFTLERQAAQSRHDELIRQSGLSYCGAYWGNGFHEDGVNSALKVCKAFGVTPSWQSGDESIAREANLVG
ncbi:MAG: FAD-dependent oxidoreductase [Planctomycetaceae bacterium]